MIKLIHPPLGARVSTHTELQDEFIKKIHTVGTDAAIDWLLPIKDSRECTYPEPIEIRWTADGSELYTVEVSETPDFEKSAVYQTGEASISLINLKIAQKYFVRINGENSGYFETADEKYRFIKIDGLLNVRDIGGINAKQGMVYRGSELFGERYNITDEGRDTFCRELGIKTELNVRNDLDIQRPHSLAGDIGYALLACRPYAEIFREHNRERYRIIFGFLAKEENYPIYIHCSAGADRTGTLAFIVGALLGESLVSMLDDYELTSLSVWGIRSRNIARVKDFVDYINGFDGDTLQSKMENAMLSLGVDMEHIESIRRIMLC